MKYILFILTILLAIFGWVVIATGSSVQSSVLDVPSEPSASENGPLVAITSHSTVTAYNSTYAQSDSTPCISASNKNICEAWEETYGTSKGLRGDEYIQFNRRYFFETGRAIGICASNDFVFGTMLYVPQYGFCIVEDRMASRYSGHTDVYYGTDVDTAMEFGRRELEITEYRQSI